MRNVNKALAMGLIIAATGGSMVASAFAADSGTASNGTSANPAPSDNNTNQAVNPNDRDKTGDVSKPGDDKAMGQSNTGASSESGRQSMMTSQPKKHMTMSRKRVEQIQTALANSGEQVQIDGVWGPKTSEALKEFQKSHNLKPTGKLDHQTREALPKQNG